jgi:hypothetical protein
LEAKGIALVFFFPSMTLCLLMKLSFFFKVLCLVLMLCL